MPHVHFPSFSLIGLLCKYLLMNARPSGRPAVSLRGPFVNQAREELHGHYKSIIMIFGSWNSMVYQGHIDPKRLFRYALDGIYYLLVSTYSECACHTAVVYANVEASAVSK